MWRRQFGGSVVYSIPNAFIGLQFEDRIEQRSYRFNVKVDIPDCFIEAQEVMKESFPSMLSL